MEGACLSELTAAVESGFCGGQRVTRGLERSAGRPWPGLKSPSPLNGVFRLFFRRRLAEDDAHLEILFISELKSSSHDITT